MSVTISNDYIYHVRAILFTGIAESKSKKAVKKGINNHCSHALPAYACAVASVEAFINEMLLSRMSKSYFKTSPLWSLEKDWYEKLEIKAKLIIVPQLLFGKTFERDKQPFQDMSLLITIRNDIVHYKMEKPYPKYLKTTDSRKITLDGKSKSSVSDFPWPHKLSCTEGVRWAHNTACDTINAILSMMPVEFRKLLLNIDQNFVPITENDIVAMYRKENVDPYKNNP